MEVSNRLTRLLDRFDKLPVGLEWRAFSFAFGRVVPFVATAGVRIESVSETSVTLTIKNRRKVRNHLGGGHAAAVALLVETASGWMVGRNIPDHSLPLIKTMNLSFRKRNCGHFRAVASMSGEQIEQLRGASKGSFLVPVTLTDARGGEPVRCEMNWAWVPAKKPAAG